MLIYAIFFIILKEGFIVKKKIAVFIVLLVVVFFCSIYADFRDDEKPVWGMMNDTAYTLLAGEWNIDLWGPVSYGIFDQLQIGTMFWIWFVQAPNINLKLNIIPETDAMPAFSIGGSFSQFSFSRTSSDDNSNSNITIRWYNIGGYITKKLTENFYLSGAYIYNGIDASASVSTSDYAILNFTGTANSSKILVDAIIQQGKTTRFFIEGVINLLQKVEYDAGGGIEWAIGDIFRLKIGIYSLIRENLFYLPFIDLHWRFK